MKSVKNIKDLDGARKKDLYSALIDGTLRIAAGSSFITLGLLMPGLLIGLDKPFQAVMKKLDGRARERELKRTLYYMKANKLLAGDYEHGLSITDKGKRRLAKAEIASLRIEKPKSWDKNWRIVFYDIPEDCKLGRNAISAKLRSIGFHQLQKSVWVHPFPCREIIERICLHYDIAHYVTYIETGYIDNQQKLAKHFENIL